MVNPELESSEKYEEYFKEVFAGKGKKKLWDFFSPYWKNLM